MSGAEGERGGLHGAAVDGRPGGDADRIAEDGAAGAGGDGRGVRRWARQWGMRRRRDGEGEDPVGAEGEPGHRRCGGVGGVRGIGGAGSGVDGACAEEGSAADVPSRRIVGVVGACDG